MIILMSEQAIKKRVRELMSIVFRRELPDADAINRADISEWDSLKHIELIFMLEEEFQLKFDEGDFEGLASLTHIVEILERKGAS